MRVPTAAITAGSLIGGWQLAPTWQYSSPVPVGVGDGQNWATDWELTTNATKIGPVSTSPTMNVAATNINGTTANATGGGLNKSLPVTYTGRNGTTYGPSTTAPTNAGDYTAIASYAGDSNYNPSSDSKDYSIAKANTTTTVTANNATYDGNPHGGTANVTGPGGLNQSVTVSYS